MATVTTVDVTTQEGSDVFPLNTNDVLDMVEKIASQNIRGAKSSNTIEDGFYEYVVDKGAVVEEAVIKMAEKQAYDKDSYSRAAKDPHVLVKYFNNWVEGQYHTTTRYDDIRKVITKETSAEQVGGEIVGSLTQGEGAEDFKNERSLLFSSTVKDYSTIINGVPATMKGVVYTLRDMYNHLKSNNSDCTSESYVSSTPVEDIRIAITTKVLNLIDVVELANIFNLSKEEMFGKLVIIDVDDIADETNWYKVVVYDKKSMGRATRLFEYGFERVEKGRYENHYLTTSRMYFHNGLFKACSINCKDACESAKDTMITTNIAKIKNILSHVTNSNTDVKISIGEDYEGTLTADEDYEISSVVVTHNGVDVTATAYTSATGKIEIEDVAGEIIIIANATEE